MTEATSKTNTSNSKRASVEIPDNGTTVSNNSSALAENILEYALSTDQDQKYFLYKPDKCGPDTPVMVSLHGVTRNAQEHAELFSPFAKRYGVILIAPLFPYERFSNYQRLGSRGIGVRADKMFDMIVNEVGEVTGASTKKLFLFGYSGGGQFIHRYSMVYPHRAIRVVVAASGWYTFPDPLTKYPYGIKKSEKLPGVTFSPARFLTIPTCVLVGEKDTVREEDMRKTHRVDRQQGINRLERAKRWFKSMTASAHTHKLQTEFLLKILPNSGHSFEECMRKGDMGRQVFDFLFKES